MTLRPSPVKEFAEARRIPVLQPASLRDAVVQEAIRAVDAEVIVVAAYGLIVPQTVLDMPTYGCINIHASLLPRWRGAAPIQRAILAGDAETGVTIMQMDAGLDSGPVLIAEKVVIHAGDTTGSLHDRLAEVGARLIVDTLARLPLVACPQPDAGICYAPKIGKSEAAIDWGLPATQIERQVRAFNPYPGASAAFRDTTVKVWSAGLAEGWGLPGSVLAASGHGIVVACGEGALRLTEVQKAGGKRVSAADFIAGARLRVGDRWSPA